MSTPCKCNLEITSIQDNFQPFKHGNSVNKPVISNNLQIAEKDALVSNDTYWAFLINSDVMSGMLYDPGPMIEHLKLPWMSYMIDVFFSSK